MAKVIAGATVSLDGFVQDADGTYEALYSDYEELTASGYMGRLQEATGAVLMGRRTYDLADDPDGYADGYEFQVPIFVVTHNPPPVAPKRNDRLWITFVPGVDEAVRQAVEAAGERDVTFIGGADVFRQLLAGGLVDELAIDVMPVLFGGGVRLFDAVGPRATLERVSVEEVGVRTCLRYLVLPTAARS